MNQNREVPPIVLKILRKFANFLKETFDDNFISMALFGSVARGNWYKGSDMDVLIIIDGLASRPMKKYELLAPLLNKLRALNDYKQLYEMGIFGINPVIYSSEGVNKLPRFLFDFTKDALIIYDCDNFLKNILAKLKEKIKTDGAIRKKLPNGEHYWILSPKFIESTK